MHIPTIAIPTPTLPNPLPTDHQALMDVFYSTWQDLSAKVREHNKAVQERAKADGVDVSSAPFGIDMETYDFLRGPRQDEIAAVMPHKVNAAVILGNTNYQIGNGGFSQLHGNGYTASLGAVITLYKGAAELGIADADKVLAILEEFAKRLEADEKSPAPAFGYAFGCEDEEEELRDSFDDLDTRYYAIENIEPLMQTMLDRFEEVALGAFMACAYRKAA